MSHPPKKRTALWRHVTEGAGEGVLKLQHCPDCGQVQYPPREVCGVCLGTGLDWRVTPGAGAVLAVTELTASVDPWFRARLPVRVALVRLVAGPVLYAFAAPGLTAGDPAMVEARIDEAGEAVLWALPDH